MAPHRLPPKPDVLNALLERSSVYIHIDPRPREVLVPNWFKKQPQLVLQVGLNLPVPIRDLEITEHGVSCTLSFNRSPHFCSLPWSAVYALVGENGRGMVWPDDIPPEVTVAQGPRPAERGRAESAGSQAQVSQGQGAGKRRRATKAPRETARLRAIGGGAAPGAATAASPEAVVDAAGAEVSGEAQAGATQAEGQAAVGQPRKAPRPAYLRVVK